MREGAPSTILLVVLAMIAAACAGAVDAVEDAPTTTVPLATSTSAEATTTTTSVPELPREMEPKYPVIMTEGVAGPDIDNMTVWAPDADGQFPLVLLLGGWSGIGSHYALTAELLAGQGVVVFAPDYRADELDGEWRNTYRDAECAYRHMRTISGDFGGDLSMPVTVVGHSTGAVVGMGLTFDEISFRADSPFDRCPMGDVPRPDRLVALSGCYYESPFDGTRYPFDPAAYGWTHLDAPVQVVVGSEDAECEAWQSEGVVDALVGHGFGDVELTVLEGADHFDVAFEGFEGANWWTADAEWFQVPNDPNGIAAVQAMLNTILAPATESAFLELGEYRSVAEVYCEAWPEVGDLLTDDANFVHVSPDGVSIPEGLGWNLGVSDDVITGREAVVAAIDAVGYPVISCLPVTIWDPQPLVSGDWVAVPFRGDVAGSDPLEGVWILRVVDSLVQWHLMYTTELPDGADFSPVDDEVVASEARDFCSVVEGTGYLRSASEFLGAMTTDPAVVNIPEGFYWPGATAVESMVQLYPPSDDIGCGDEIATIGNWSAQPITIDNPSINLSQVGMMVHNHQEGLIRRQFAHFTRASGENWGLPLED